MNYKIRVANPVIDDSDIASVVKALREKRLSSGVYAENFENKFAEFIGTKHAISVNSATAALQLVLAATRIGRGDEVITTPYTFAATANVIILQGAKPVFVDIEPYSFNIDPSKFEEKITKRTKAVIPIHYGGQAAEMKQIMKIAREHDLEVIEDAAPAAGATYYGKMVGGIGNAGAFSFFPDKNMTTGEGGMLTTNSDEIAKKARVMKKHGAPSRYFHTEIGWNFKLSDINAALGITQLKKLPKTIKEKNALASTYSNLFEDEVGEKATLPIVKKGCTHTFNLYNVKFKTERERNVVKRNLEKNGIETRICFPPVHLQPIYVKMMKFKPGSFPVAEECAKTTLCMPMFSGLTLKNQRRIVRKVKEVLN